jgi:hypothetical protein
MSNITKDYAANLQKQYKILNHEINEKAEALKTFPVDSFVLNADVGKLIQEIDVLNKQRDAVLQELKKIQEDN